MPSPESLQTRAMLLAHVKPIFDGSRPLEVMRAHLEGMSGQAPLPPGTRVEKTTIGRTPAEWVSGPDTAEGRVVLYLHGGGFALGSCGSHRDLAARIAIACAARALVLDYRLAPEHPFPAGLDDAVAAYRWLLQSGVEPGHLLIAGDSAGGGLTLSTLITLRDAGDPLPAAAMVLSPWIDLASTGASCETHAEVDPMIHGAVMRRFAKYYLGDRDLKTPLASPLHAELHGLPPLLIHVGTEEVLLDDSTRLAARAREAGVDVTLKVWDDLWHVFHSTAGFVPEAKQAIEEVGAFARSRLPPSVTPARAD